MGRSKKRGVCYALVPAEAVNVYLKRGFEPFGSALYHPRRESFLQSVVRYRLEASVERSDLTPREK
jgi:hypothetical protein